jgi:hypothetical protein
MRYGRGESRDRKAAARFPAGALAGARFSAMIQEASDHAGERFIYGRASA